MNSKEIKGIVTDWRVAVLLILIVLSVFAIYPHFDSDGHLATNLQYGLDLQQGSWIQLEFNAEVVGFTTDRPVSEFITELATKLDTEVVQVDETHLEVRKYYTQAELEPVFTAAGGKLTTYSRGVSKDTAEDLKLILENKINSVGTKDAKVQTLTGMNNIARYVRVELAGVDMNEAQEIVGRQGKFEIRIQTVGNETDHVLFGDAITSVGNPEKDTRSGVWGVPFTLSEDGALALQQAAIKYDMTTNPEDHYLIMILDNQTVFNAPMVEDAAAKLQTSPNRQWSASTGTGDHGLSDANRLNIHLKSGALPVSVNIAGSGGVTAPLGERYKMMALLAGFFALLTVAFVIFYRYREPGIVLPMVLINASEILILLGFISLIKFQLDLPTIAGLIAVLGTGIDQLVIITDEILHEGKVPSPTIYLKRLSRALSIIVTAAATVFIAMAPLALMDLSTLKGFAIITILGVLVGVIITRPAYGKIIMEILSK